MPFVWIPSIQNKFCEKIEGLVCFSVLIGSHGPETHVQLKTRFSKFVQKFRKFSDFDTEKVPKMGSNQNMSEFSPWTGISWWSWRTIVTVITFLQKTFIFTTLYLICTQKAQYWCKSQCRKFCMNARGKHSRGRFLRYIARFLRFSGVNCFQTHKVLVDLRFFVSWSKIKEMF